MLHSAGSDVPGLIVHLVTEPGRVDNSKRNTSAFLIELEFCSWSAGSFRNVRGGVTHAYRQ